MTAKSVAELRREYKARRKAEGFAGLTHGTASTYSAGCHCVPCTAGHAAANRIYKAARRHGHGTVAVFDAGCTCNACVMADALYGEVAS